jgi:hypothetical protein
MKIQIKSRWSGEVIFEHYCENNTIAITLRAAVEIEANLYGAYLEGAYLKGANLKGANLYGANLKGANLYGAYLYGANLEGANLYGANLKGANLYGANLKGANLYGANLKGANLEVANLEGANLKGANLEGANLKGANLEGANHDEKTNWPHFQLPPEKGAFIAYKKITGGIVIELQIPAKAKRTSSLVGRKCRAEYVKVLTKGVKAVGKHDKKTMYETGKITRADKYDDDIRVECTHGIHFFMTRKEAEEY